MLTMRARACAHFGHYHWRRENARTDSLTRSVRHTAVRKRASGYLLGRFRGEVKRRCASYCAPRYTLDA
ncbi:unnamed protein product [Leptosia nina]|uniref:Uncharacterized protein n=1 Tax=Leptosia nina TaxID=320188 RepID=A0AAV1K452_9NEOP